MKPIKVLDLSEVSRLKLEKGYHNGPTHSFISDAYIKYFNQLPFLRQYLGMNYHRYHSTV